MEAGDGTEETARPLALSSFQLSEELGFLLPDPLVRDTVPVCHGRQGRKQRGWGVASWWGFNLMLLYKCL